MPQSRRSSVPAHTPNSYHRGKTYPGAGFGRPTRSADSRGSPAEEMMESQQFDRIVKGWATGIAPHGRQGAGAGWPGRRAGRADDGGRGRGKVLPQWQTVRAQRSMLLRGMPPRRLPTRSRAGLTRAGGAARRGPADEPRVVRARDPISPIGSLARPGQPPAIGNARRSRYCQTSKESVQRVKRGRCGMSYVAGQAMRVPPCRPQL